MASAHQQLYCPTRVRRSRAQDRGRGILAVFQDEVEGEDVEVADAPVGVAAALGQHPWP